MRRCGLAAGRSLEPQLCGDYGSHFTNEPGWPGRRWALASERRQAKQDGIVIAVMDVPTSNGFIDPHLTTLRIDHLPMASLEALPLE